MGGAGVGGGCAVAPCPTTVYSNPCSMNNWLRYVETKDKFSRLVWNRDVACLKSLWAIWRIDPLFNYLYCSQLFWGRWCTFGCPPPPFLSNVTHSCMAKQLLHWYIFIYCFFRSSFGDGVVPLAAPPPLLVKRDTFMHGKTTFYTDIYIYICFFKQNNSIVLQENLSRL